MTEVVLDAAGIQKALKSMADAIVDSPGDGPWAVVGIRRGGEHLAHRLAKHIADKTGHEPPIGTVDITLYRDDGFGPHDWPDVGVTQIGFRLREHTVVLVDDVLYTGRTVRAALDAILDYGRPKAVRLAVLVDRGLRELPVRGDAVGLTLQTSAEQHVDVTLTDAGEEADAVLLGPKPNGKGKGGEGESR